MTTTPTATIGNGCPGCKAGLPREKSQIHPQQWIHVDHGTKTACSRPPEEVFAVDFKDRLIEFRKSQEEERSLFKTAWLECLERNKGMQTKSYRVFPVNRTTLLRWRKADKKFDRAWRDLLKRLRGSERPYPHKKVKT